MRHLLPLSLLALLASGCERMPEDSVFLYGRLLKEDGSPQAGSLRVERALNRSFVDGQYNPEVDWNFEPYSEGDSQDSGDFTLEIVYGDTYVEDLYSYASHRFRVYPPLDADGNGVFVAFFFQDDVELPALRPWTSGLAVTSGPEGPTLSFAPAPPGPEVPPAGRQREFYDNEGNVVPRPPSTTMPVVQLHGAGALVWQQLQAASPWVPSPYVLEDFQGVEAQVRALSADEWYFEPLAAQYSSVTFRMEWRSPRVAVPPGGLTPISRGAGCSAAPVDGACPFTDGKLLPRDTLPESQQPGAGSDFGVEAVSFTLPAPARPRRLVVRALETTLGYTPRMRLVLEGSTDAVSWAPLGDFPIVNYDEKDRNRELYSYALTNDEDSPFDAPIVVFNGPLFLDAPLTGDAPVRHVRLRVTGEDGKTPGRLLKLAELSLFE
ncbi:hypothetical protein [Pyxidicoccus xibeiensis]|uniref:hypothetical protein n=1 Tax=Pyxidicoccus xibeiensis TaxID=2906759 RepID=UPI0020A76B2F|nr:hypothetical protein [Pyxidicoccus xibeiensis]MCP3143958.1 hypothetical protein [Pyxidicoccus xibeiensis]